MTSVVEPDAPGKVGATAGGVIDANASTVLFREIDTAGGQRFGVATLNAPASLNSLSLDMVDLLHPQLLAWAEDPNVAGVMLDAAGDKALCAGGDLRQLYVSIRECGDHTNVYAQEFFSREYRLDHLIHTYPKPFLCWGHGIVMGGGIGLMSGASHRVVTAKSRLAMPEIAIGLFPDVAGSWFLQRMPRHVGLFLALTGASFNAADALFLGVADFFVPHEAKAEVLKAIGDTRWGDDAASQLSHLLEAHRGEVALPESMVQRHFETIAKVIGHDSLLDIASRMDALASGSISDDAWLVNAAQAFKKGSPTSAALSFDLLNRSRHLSLAEVFRLEFDVALGCCAHADFPEGIRALLIEKDKHPMWAPAALEGVGPEFLASHFEPRHHGHHPLADLA
ncbi:MAG: Enoyl-CoA hydratase/isomerase [Rhizobacter sp.]|nr:Enoyl-CoA hydratase/isomerase [Rhizobacter sp.]